MIPLGFQAASLKLTFYKIKAMSEVIALIRVGYLRRLDQCVLERERERDFFEKVLKKQIGFTISQKSKL